MLLGASLYLTNSGEFLKNMGDEGPIKHYPYETLSFKRGELIRSTIFPQILILAL
jgi:hypothetical protein